MKELPILFNTEMVQAILDGSKTQTRRIINPQPEVEYFKLGGEYPQHQIKCEEKDAQYTFFRSPKTGRACFILDVPAIYNKRGCPYGLTGDHLWVRETFAFSEGKHEPYDTVSYRADDFHRDIKREGSDFPESEMCLDGWHDAELSNELDWKPSIHMPKAVARIWLEVEEVRVERVQDISEEDILAEGVRIPVDGPNNVVFRLGVENSAFSFLPEWKEGEKYTQHQILKAFWAELWCKVNGRASWDANPWVWVVKFRRILNK